MGYAYWLLGLVVMLGQDLVLSKGRGWLSVAGVFYRGVVVVDLVVEAHI